MGPSSWAEKEHLCISLQLLFPPDSIQPCYVSKCVLGSAVLPVWQYASSYLSRGGEEHLVRPTDLCSFVLGDISWEGGKHPGTGHPRPLWCELSHNLRHKRTIPSVHGLPRNVDMMFLTLSSGYQWHPCLPRDPGVMFLSQEITKVAPRQSPQGNIWGLF